MFDFDYELGMQSEELAAFGAIVHTCSWNQKELDQRLEERNSRGFKASGSVCDLLSRPQRTQLMETVSSLFHGKLHILVSFNKSFVSVWNLEMHFWLLTTNLKIK